VGLRKQALSGVKWTSGATAITASLQFIQIALLARLLVPEDFGLMALAMIVIGFAQAYADMGMSSAIVHRQDATRQQLSSLFWLNILVGFGVFVVMLAVAPLLASLYEEPRLEVLIALAATVFLIAPAGHQFSMLMQKALRFDVLAVIDVSSTAVGFAASIVLAYNGQGVYSLVWGQLANAVTRSLILVNLGTRDWRPALRFRGGDLAGYVRFGAYQMGERTINFLGANLDKLLIGSLIGVHGLGIYNVAYQLVMKPMQVFNPIITRVAFPLFAMVQTDDARLRAGYLDAIRVIALVLFPVYVWMILLAEPLTLLVLGEGWSSAVTTVQILGVLAMFYSLGNPLGSLLLAKGRVEIGFYLNVWRAALFAIAIWTGVRWGVDGVASALVLATAFGMFPVGFWIRRLLVGIRPLEYVSAFGPMLATAMVMCACLLLIRNYGPEFTNRIVGLVVLTVAGAIVYLAIIVPWQRPFFHRLISSLR
jgi:O-antigen/teichoic acid export membrane protein